MAESAAESVWQIVKNSLIGSGQKKAFSAVLLAIIGYLIYMKNKKSSTDSIRIKDEFLKGKKVTMRSLRKAERATSMLYFSSASKN